MTISELKPFQDKIAVLHLKDGEIATVKIVFVDAEYEDIIVDIIETNVTDRYTVPIKEAGFAVKASDIESVAKI